MLHQVRCRAVRAWFDTLCMWSSWVSWCRQRSALHSLVINFNTRLKKYIKIQIKNRRLDKMLPTLCPSVINSKGRWSYKHQREGGLQSGANVHAIFNARVERSPHTIDRDWQLQSRMSLGASSSSQRGGPRNCYTTRLQQGGGHKTD